MQADAPFQRRPGPGAAIGVGVLLLIAVAGLFYVKWDPYFHKAFVAAAHHSIGASIVSQNAAAPAAGWAAAWGFAVSYGKSIWEALVVGLLLGSGVQAVLPRSWLLRVLGGRQYRSVAVAGAAAVPSMM